MGWGEKYISHDHEIVKQREKKEKKIGQITVVDIVYVYC